MTFLEAISLVPQRRYDVIAIIVCFCAIACIVGLRALAMYVIGGFYIYAVKKTQDRNH